MEIYDDFHDYVKCKKDKERNHGNYNCTRR